MLALFHFPAPVLLERRLATVDAVVRELGEKSGRDLAIRPELRDEALYVRLGPHEPDVLMRLVARAASAEWTRDGDRYRLGRSPGLVRRQRQAERAALTAEIAPRLRAVLGTDDAVPWKESLDPVDAALKATEPLMVGPGYERWNNIRTRMVGLSPQGRLLSRTLRALGPEGLADLPANTVVHYAIHPRRWQRPMPGLTKASLDQFVRESAMVGRRLDALTEERRKATVQRLTLYGFDKNRVPGADSGAVLTVGRSPDGDFPCFLTAFDAQGHPSLISRLDLYAPDPPRPTDLPGYDAWTKTVPALPPAPPIVDPVAEEPLANLVGARIEALTAAMGGETILAVPDATAERLDAIDEAKPTLGAYARALGGLVAFEPQDGALVGHVRRPTEAAAVKASRTPMRDLLRSTSPGDAPDLEATLGYFARQNPDAGVTGFESRVLDRLVGRLDAPLSRALQTGRGNYLVLAGLTPVQRAALWAGKPVPFATFGPAARAALERQAFTKSARFEVDGDRIDDPTVWFDGLTADGFLLLRQRRTDLALVGMGKQGLESYSPEGLGYVKARQDAGEKQAEDLDLDALRVRPGREEALLIGFQFAPGFVTGDLVQDLRVSGPSVPLKGLPPEYRKVYDEAYETARKARAGGG